jgi:hypothetical protein
MCLSSRAVQQQRQHLSLLAYAKPWLAGLLALLWLVLMAEAVGHHCESDRAAHHDCAACQMAHGTLLADGAVGVSWEVPVTELTIQAPCVPPLSTAIDLRLSPGRAPPA